VVAGLASTGCTIRDAHNVERSASAVPVRMTPATGPAAAPAAPAKPADPVIVRLVGRDKVVTITAGRSGPLYSAATKGGELLATDLTLDELRQQRPDVYQFVFPATVARADDRVDGAGRPVPTAEAWSGR
jgi:hypothetical protein